MDHEPRGLGDHRQIVVLVADVEGDLFGLERDGSWLRQLDHDLVAGLETVGRPHGATADVDPSFLDERLEDAT
jgi:hypothetical protein